MMDFESRVEATARLLLAAAREAGMAVTGDERVGEADAAALLGFGNPCSLKNARSEGRAPDFYRVAGRVTYRIQDLAHWLETAREPS